MATEIKEVKYKEKSLYVAEAVSDTNTRVLLLPQTESKTITVTDSNPIGNTYTWSNLTAIEIPLEITVYLAPLTNVSTTNYWMQLSNDVSQLGIINSFNGYNRKLIRINVEAYVTTGGSPGVWQVKVTLSVGNTSRLVTHTSVSGGTSCTTAFYIQCYVNRDQATSPPTIEVNAGQYLAYSSYWQQPRYDVVTRSPEDIAHYQITGPLQVTFQAYGGNNNAVEKSFTRQNGYSDTAWETAAKASKVYVKIPTGASIKYTRYPYSASAPIS